VSLELTAARYRVALVLVFILFGPSMSVVQAQQEEIDQLLKSGAEDFVKKPFTISELTNTVNAVLQVA